jgi:hypothetical protein
MKFTVPRALAMMAVGLAAAPLALVSPAQAMSPSTITDEPTSTSDYSACVSSASYDASLASSTTSTSAVESSTDGASSGMVTAPSTTDPEFVSAVREACSVSTVGGVSAPQVVGAAGVTRAGDLTASDGTTLAAAAATYPIYTETWWQTLTGCCWRERNSGRIYFDYHGHVWSTTLTYGYKGWHHCDDDWAIGYTISHTLCNTERRYDLYGAGGHPISEWDHFKVSAFVKGFPISVSHTMHANAYANGAVYYH